MKKINNFLDTASLFKIFIASNILFSFIMATLFGMFGMYTLMIPSRAVICLILFSSIFAGMYVLMVHQTRLNDALYKQLEDFENKVKLATSVSTLMSLDTELEGFNYVGSAEYCRTKYKSIQQLIDNRLKYEFKL